jgi:hypothetical protein
MPLLATWLISLDSYSRWERIDLIGISLVAIGVLGEIYLTIRGIWFPYNPTNFAELEKTLWLKKHSWEVIFGGLVAVGVALELGALPKSLNESHRQITSLNQSNLNLSIELEKLRYPNTITSEQREKFIEILCEPHNASKIPILVFFGGDDRATEQFAFQIQKILDEAGYGFTSSKYQPPMIQMPTNMLYITNGIAHIDLPPFQWNDVTPIKMKSGTIAALQVTNAYAPVATNAPPNSVLNSEIPFTDKEPNVIALFSGDVPPPSIMPSVNVFYPTPDNPFRGFSYSYNSTKDPNAVLCGVCEVLHEVGITVGKNTTPNVLPRGCVALFIPSR